MVAIGINKINAKNNATIFIYFIMILESLIGLQSIVKNIHKLSVSHH